MNFYQYLADLTVMVHVAYVAFVVIGMLLIVLGLVLGWRWVRNFWFRAIHLAMIAIVVAETFLGMVCPLTTLEDTLRAWAGETVEEGTFLGRLAHELLFYDAPEWVFTLSYCLFGAVVLLTFIFAPPHWPSRNDRHKSALP